MREVSNIVHRMVLVLLVAAIALPGMAATVSSKGMRSPRSARKIQENSRTQRRMNSAAKKRPAKSATRKSGRRGKRMARRFVERFYTSSFAQSQTEGDVIAGEDPVVRAAAIEALGNMNGSVVAIDPQSGRILAMVNQKLALGEGAIPCSTIKVPVALAALQEGIITKDTPVSLGGNYSLNLTKALAVSNNAYFEAVGRRLGFEKVAYHARQFGLGELAGYNIEGEHLGVYPDQELSAKRGGVGRMCSFGEGVSMTPLQLGALVSAIANGGTLYYLQHPRTAEQAAAFSPKVKRYLSIEALIPQIQDGMRGAVEYGTARTLGYNFKEESILGKTGTCSENGTRFGWFASYANTSYGKIAVVVFLQGGRPTYGPKAAELAGKMYRRLYDDSFFAAKTPMPQSGHPTDAAGVGVSQ